MNEQFIALILGLLTMDGGCIGPSFYTSGSPAYFPRLCWEFVEGGSNNVHSSLSQLFVYVPKHA